MKEKPACGTLMLEIHPKYYVYLLHYLIIYLFMINSIFSQNCRLFSQNNRPIYECANLSGNWIPDVPLIAMVFRLTHTPLNTVPRLNNTSIVSLSLNFCNISTIEPNIFSKLTNLRQVDLANNWLNSFVLDLPLPPIEKLLLAKNRFNRMPNLRNLVHLKHLDLSYNQLNFIPKNSLKLDRLEIVDLSNNNLTSIHQKDFGSRIAIVELNNNPWMCDCHLRDFVYFQGVALQVSDWLRCYSPPWFRGVRWNDLKLLDFACGPEITQPISESITVIEGDPFSLVCMARGDPAPTTEWRSTGNNRTVHSDGRLSVSSLLNNVWMSGTLSAKFSILEDQNGYHCVASTGFNKSTKYFTLNIIPKTTTSEKPSTVVTVKIQIPNEVDLSELFIFIICLLLIIITSLCIIFTRKYLKRREQYLETENISKRLVDNMVLSRMNFNEEIPDEISRIPLGNGDLYNRMQIDDVKHSYHGDKQIMAIDENQVIHLLPVIQTTL